jgi:DNA-binding helix-hairpin-helix protein with protein kinase domain
MTVIPLMMQIFCDCARDLLSRLIDLHINLSKLVWGLFLLDLIETLGQLQLLLLLLLIRVLIIILMLILAMIWSLILIAHATLIVQLRRRRGALRHSTTSFNLFSALLEVVVGSYR